jgi:glyoxylase-like metal-dependent hydrolase (beta-lactamase superfamily II)
MCVLVGSERSLVIDAGMGYCDLRAIVESLTDTLYDVVITHAHPDHAGMLHQFESGALWPGRAVPAREQPRPAGLPFVQRR